MNSLLKILFLLLTFGINLALAAESSNIQEIETLAEQGDAQAQFDLAQLYYEGTGIPSNYQLAVNFSRLAATQGLAAAQSFLGNLYRMGQGVPSDLVQAYVWYNLAAANGDTEATQVRILLEDELTDKQIADAQQISSECFSDGYQSCELTIEELIASRLQAQFQAQVEVQPESQVQVEVQPE
ncbi:MAG: tetratricopeptide repeat protein, partial [Pseudohongiellaceae bacterium]